ncbi:MAG TPA: isochorismatase family protein, partial [Thermomicrobiaceae bacterium]|nr:isochorismatase family protein [Thermomicrobiaceae bacterium]
HPELRLPREAVILTKGTDPHEDAYSVFQAQTDNGTLFRDRLAKDRVAHLYVGGLATDYCVRASVLDALSAGLAATLLIDAIAGVELNPGDSERAIAEMTAAGAATATLSDIAPGI